MNRVGRWTGGAVLLVILGSCLPGQGVQPSLAASPTPPAPDPDSIQKATAAHDPGQVAPAAPTTPEIQDFNLQGAMTQGGALIGVVPAGAAGLTLNGLPVPIAPNGQFLIAFDRDAPPSATLVASFADGRTISRTLAVSPRAWDISRLSTLPKIPLPQPQFDALRPAELAQINTARSMVTDAAGWNQRFLWPTLGRISTLFGSQRIYANGEAGSYHSGLDVAVPTGTQVLAPADGVVILAADHPFTLEGNLLMVDHGMGLSSAFLHLSRIDVRVGDHVKRGQPIALSGMTGRATGPHLHWSLKWRDARIDPLLMAGPMPGAR